MTDRWLQAFIDTVAPCPWTAHAGSSIAARRRVRAVRAGTRAPIYTAEQRRIRDATPWTLVQGVLAPLQFVIFAASLYLVVRYLAVGEGYALATASVVIKTLVLYAIMVTGAIWEKVVFGRYLFAPAFFWEDVFSMVVLALHTAYLAAVIFSIGTADQQMMIALAAYFTYVINAGQFLWKLRLARLEGAAS
ncbi:2-vinyl bacteriochlorophyllide hydratase [Alkalicaulis satelles]|uniref:2-vinyl bacteriochlorophyllide hydratase n=1 Tax=Alkalicaulis satelles TaxID=2609175 RepID=A0A5M6ZGX7_9PROT|nr:2-vinyl bacteriochlorophyllide hydratase [Alkalicaulis satelles]KAA5804022.1 2-vinyl bacteriochlorophyllide hydratase [Alkalicaulis satelles]